MIGHPTNHGGLGGSKTYLTNEGAMSEQMRLKHIKEMRERQEEERAKQELADKKRKFDQNKQNATQREFELRRLQSEVTRAETFVKDAERTCTEWHEKLTHQKTSVFNTGAEIQKLQVQIQQLKNKQDKEEIAMVHLQSELDYKIKQKEKTEQTFHELDTKKKREVSEIERLHGENVRLEQEMRSLESKLR